MKRALILGSKGQDGQFLTEKLLGFANGFSFVLRTELGISNMVKELISDLSIFLIDKKLVNEWLNQFLTYFE